MANTEINEGRGFPLAKQKDAPAAVVIAPHRVLLFELIEGALRAEHGVRMRQAQSGKTDYYAGRRAGFIASAARLISTMYGEDYDASKEKVSEGVRAASRAADSIKDLIDPDVARAMATSIAEFALSR